eukprot:7395296-Lingulodinium_polyedra.AAC.1
MARVSRPGRVIGGVLRWGLRSGPRWSASVCWSHNSWRWPSPSTSAGGQPRRFGVCQPPRPD